MSTINIDGINLHYEKYGSRKKDNVILLHGWGQNLEMMAFIGDHLKSRFNVFKFDSLHVYHSSGWIKYSIIF